MNTGEFMQKIVKKEIKNGTIFDVYKNDSKIGQVGVVRDVIVYFEFTNNNIPKDLLIGEYDFIEVEGE